MRLDVSVLTRAAAVVAAVQYLVCAALVALVPGSFTRIAGYMVHADLSDFERSISWLSFLVGIVSWTALCAASAALFAAVYNRHVK